MSNKTDTPNENEGNPDFTNDLSRVYVSMNTEGDRNLGLGNMSLPGLEDTITPITLQTATGTTADTKDSGPGPYTIIKSTHPRKVAREDGSVKIVHESGSSIVMDKNGNIQITASGTIVLGKDGTAVGPAITPVGPQSFVRGEDMAAAFNQLVTALETFCNTPSLAAGGVTPGYGGPNAILGGAVTALKATLTTLYGAAGTHKMDDALSEFIKGE